MGNSNPPPAPVRTREQTASNTMAAISELSKKIQGLEKRSQHLEKQIEVDMKRAKMFMKKKNKRMVRAID